MSKRPVFLNVFKIRLSVMGFVSIAHRVSGVVMLLSLPFLYWFWAQLVSLEQATMIDQFSTSVLGKNVFLLIALSFIYHCLAGIRHLVMDCGVAEDKVGGQTSAWLTWGVFALLAIYTGVKLWA